MTPWEVERYKLRIAEDLYRNHPSEATRRHLATCTAAVARWEAWLRAREPAPQETLEL